MVIKSRFRKGIKKDYFIGRESLFSKLELKLNNLKNEEYSIVNYFGLGGIGKSTLTKEIKKRYENENILVFLYDFENSISILNFYENLNEFLYKNRVSCVYFFMAFLVYYKRKHPNSNLKEKLPFIIQNSDAYTEILELFTEDGIVPGVNIASKYIYKFYKKAKEKYFLDQNILEELKELEKLELNEIEEQIPYFLSIDIKNFCEKNSDRKILFVLDTYEKLWNIYKNDNFKLDIDEWITDIVSELVNTNTLFIISGREELKWTLKNPEWEKFIDKKQLDVFTYEESLNLISKLGIENERIAHNIAAFSKGYPFYIELSLDIYERNKETSIFDDLTNHEKILNRFKDNLGAKQTTILEYLSVPRRFDNELYSYISKEFNFDSSESFFKELISFSFFEIDENVYKIHNLITKSFNNSLSDIKKDKINAALFSYYDRLINQRPNETLYYDEAIYHLLNITYNEKEILKWFQRIKNSLIRLGEYELLSILYVKAIESIDKSNNLYFEFSVELLELYVILKKMKKVKKIIDILSVSNAPLSLIDNIDYYKIYFEAKDKRKEIKQNSSTAIDLIDKFSKVINKTDEKNIKAKALIQSSKIRRYTSSYESSKTMLISALKICDDESVRAGIYEELGFLCRDIKDFERAIKYFTKALDIMLEIYDKNHIEIAKCYRGLSEIFILKRDFSNASEIIPKTIDIFSKFYDLDSSAVLSEYRKLYKVMKKDKYLEYQSLDYETKYLILIEKDFENKDKYINRLLLNTKDKIETIIRISKILSIANNDEAIKIIEDINYQDLSSFDKHKLILQRYFLSRNYRESISSQTYYLNSLVEVAKNINRDKYIGELKRSASFFVEKKMYNKVEECYLVILENLNNINYKNELINTYDMYLRLAYTVNDKEKFEDILEKFIDILEKYEQWHKIAILLEQKIFFYKKNGEYDDVEIILLKIKDIYKNINDLNRVDSTNGKLIEYYEKQNNFDNALILYEEQIDIRKKQNELSRLSKAYKFLSDFYATKLKNPIEGEKILNEGLHYLLNSNGKISIESIDLFFVSMQNYYEEYNKEKLIDILNFRLDYFEKNNEANEYMKMRIYNNLESYYLSINDLFSALKQLKKQLEIEENFKNHNAKIQILLKIRDVYFRMKDFIKYLECMFDIYSTYILVRKYDVAKNYLGKLIAYNYKYKVLEPFELQKKLNTILFNLLKLNRLNEYVDSLIILKDSENINIFRFYSFNLKIATKIVSEIKILEKLSNIFYAKKEKIAATIFYEKYIDLKLASIRAKYDKQDEFYIESLEKISLYNYYKLEKEHKLRYEKFKQRIENSTIINGRVIDKIILNCISKITSISIDNDKDVVLLKLKEYTKLFFEDNMIIEKIKNRKMAQSVFLQGFYCVVENFDFHYLGLTKSEFLVRYLLANTSYCDVKVGGTNPLILNRNDLDDSCIVSADITDYDSFVNDTENYKILLKKAFFDKDIGVYIPSKEEIMKNVLFYIGNNSIVFSNMKFQDIVDEVLEKFEYEDKDDILRVINVLKNLYTSDIFEEDFSYKNFDEKLFTINLNYDEIVKKIKDNAFKTLSDMLKELDIINFEKIFLFLKNR